MATFMVTFLCYVNNFCVALHKPCVISGLMSLLEMSDKSYQLWDIFRTVLLYNQARGRCSGGVIKLLMSIK